MIYFGAKFIRYLFLIDRKFYPKPVK